MATSLPPVDTSVVLPKSVQAAAAAAEAIHKAAYQTSSAPAPAPEPAPQPAPQPARLPADPDQPIQIVAVSEPLQPAPQPAAQQQPVSDQVPPQPAPAPAPEPAPDNWEHRYLSMKGRYDQSVQTIAGMQETMSQLGDEVSRLTAMVTQRARQEQPQHQQPQKLITADDEKTFGAEIIDLTKRAALEVVKPELDNLRTENNQLRQRVSAQAANGVYVDLNAQIPNWKEINTSPRFLQWLSLRDIYSGEVRGKMLRQAFAAANAPRVLAFFNGFLTEERATGHLPDPAAPAANMAPRQPAVNLVNLAAPGVRPATDTNAPADKPIFTHKQIAEFYSQQGRARYVGREEDRKNDEREIFAAQREGRIR